MVRMAPPSSTAAQRQPDPPHQRDHRLELPQPVAVVVHHAHRGEAAQLRLPGGEGARIGLRRLVLDFEGGGKRVLAPPFDQVGHAGKDLAEALLGLRRVHLAHFAHPRGARDLGPHPRPLLGRQIGAHVDDQPGLPAPGRDRPPEIGAHQQEEAAHEQAHRDREHGQQTHPPAARGIDAGLAEEVGDGAEEGHGRGPADSGTASGGASRSLIAPASSPVSRPRSRVSTRRCSRRIVSRSWVATSTVVPRTLTSIRSS